MEVKDFERYLMLPKLRELSLKKRQESNSEESFDEMLELDSELRHLNQKLEELLFNNQNNTEAIITKLKNSLKTYNYNFYSNKPNETLNEVKVIREIMNLLDTYDSWKLKYSEYTLPESKNKQIAVWEQNRDGQIRNHKVWNVTE